jgi:hypothetical protein
MLILRGIPTLRAVGREREGKKCNLAVGKGRKR